MEFSDRNNKVPLICAVFVGLLALGGNYFARALPVIVQRLPESLPEVSGLAPKLSMTSSAETEDPVPPTPIETIRDIENQLNRLFDPSLEQKRVFSPAVIKQLVEQADKAQLAVATNEQAELDRQQEAKHRRLKIYFMAAELLPETYSQPFLDESEAYLAAQSGEEEAEIIVLRFYHENQLSQPLRASLLQDLRRFDELHHNAAAGIALHKLLAEELAQSGDYGLAEDVLQLGISIYRGQPQVGRLVNQLADQREAVLEQ